MATASILFVGLSLEERTWNPGPAAVSRLALPASLARRTPVGARAAVDDDRDVRVVLVVLDHLFEELVLELARDDAVDHALSVGRLEPRDFRDHASVRVDARVPRAERRLELLELVASFGEADRLRRLGQNAVLVPRDVPRHGDHDLRVHAREWDDARVGLAEALADAANGPAIGARVEKICGLDHRTFVDGEPAENRLGRERFFGSGATRVEERAEAEALATRLLLEGRRGRAPLLEPALLRGDVLAERADVNEVFALGGEAHRPLPCEERSFTDRAGLRANCPRCPHRADYSPPVRTGLRARLVAMCVLHCNLLGLS